MAEFVIVGWVASVRRFLFLSLELDVVGRSAAGSVLVYLFPVREGEPRLAVLTIVLEVFVGGVLIVFALPAELSKVVLTVERQALLDFIFFVRI